MKQLISYAYSIPQLFSVLLLYKTLPNNVRGQQKTPALFITRDWMLAKENSAKR
jgi:hypothetical protein